MDLKEASGKVTITVRFRSKLRGASKDEIYVVKFEPNRLRFVRMHKANDIVKATYDMDALFPTKFALNGQPQLNVQLQDGDLVGDGDAIIPWYNSQLNPIQKSAVKFVLRADCSHFSYIINGPPGKRVNRIVAAESHRNLRKNNFTRRSFMQALAKPPRSSKFCYNWWRIYRKVVCSSQLNRTLRPMWFWSV